MSNRIYGYCRVSSDEQAEKGVSLDAQRARISAMALLKSESDAPAVEIIEDAGESAKDLKRPGIKRLIELIQSRQVDMLIVYKFDRLSRDMRDSLYLTDLFKKNKVELVTIADVSHDMGTAFGRLMSGMSMLLSEFERGQISERTTNTLQYIKTTGCPVGPPPYGFSAQDRPEVNGKRLRMELQPNPEEQHTIRVAREMRDRGDSYREMADQLNDAGYRTRKGGLWHFTGMKGLLESKLVGE